ncbi:MAG: hypothetical protein ABR95_08650 [Sphingobacteriales bacterium BACL12 MAG-120813-bin55]|jgi:hypothetical protein|nr:MAG: hypothetical protein ABR94_03080 [Sphingobacteriales bacterium BACL12 MAG-120802-bin5]KRP13987.1 MAG: hypothetical protein ABR95_08650 [Sphingobacteriales bacterium BACL12 MAG-120813-bin55]
MQELTRQIMEKTGISEEQARISIETTAAYLKQKMPESFGGQIDHMLAGGTLSEGMKKSLHTAAMDARDRMEDLMSDLGQKTNEAMDKVRDSLEDLFHRKKKD